MAEAQYHKEHDHERSDVPARVPVWIAVGILVLLPVSIALVVFLMNTVWAPPAAGPDRFGGGERPSPTPAVQTDPQADLDALQKRWRRQLHSYGWVDREAGIAHVPIDVAMDRIAGNGLPQRDRPPGPVRTDSTEASP